MPNLLIPTETMILFALAPSPGCGEDIASRVATAIGTRPHQGSLYPALESLVRRRLIAPTEGPQRPAGSGGRPRKHYRITPSGQLALHGWLAHVGALAKTFEPRGPGIHAAVFAS